MVQGKLTLKLVRAITQPGFYGDGNTLFLRVAPDGNTRAVLSYTAVWLFERPAEGDAWLSAPSRRLPLDVGAARQVEAIAWLDPETLIVTNKQRDWFEVEAKN